MLLRVCVIELFHQETDANQSIQGAPPRKKTIFLRNESNTVIFHFTTSTMNHNERHIARNCFHPPCKLLAANNDNTALYVIKILTRSRQPTQQLYSSEINLLSLTPRR